MNDFFSSVHEYSSILTQLSSHIDYLSASTRFILQHTSTNPPSPLSLITETCERDQVTAQVQVLVSASKDLSYEVKKIEKTVYKVSKLLCTNPVYNVMQFKYRYYNFISVAYFYCRVLAKTWQEASLVLLLPLELSSGHYLAPHLHLSVIVCLGILSDVTSCIYKHFIDSLYKFEIIA